MKDTEYSKFEKVAHSDILEFTDEQIAFVEKHWGRLEDLGDDVVLDIAKELLDDKRVDGGFIIVIEADWSAVDSICYEYITEFQYYEG